MLKLDDTLYFSSISFNHYHNAFWQRLANELGPDARFFINIGRRVNPNRFVTRNGEWSLPWRQELIPGFEMPDYDPGFNKTFEEVTDTKAYEIKSRIQAGERFAVMYSGGIDSTVIMSALIKNLTDEELASVTVCASVNSIIENPVFWEKFIHNRLAVRDSSSLKYDDIIEAGMTPITADEGDCIFGTLIGLTLYANYDQYIKDLSAETRTKLAPLKYRISDPEVHFSTYKDLIIKHLSIEGEPDFGRILYEKYVHNINTSSVPIHSLHDFFWWLIFNVKYLNCAVRGALYLNDRIGYQDCIYRVVNWFSDPEYQRWSMANNNNGQKIQRTLSTYKMAAREYIYGVDQNHWYKNFKIKLESLWTIGIQQDLSQISVDRRPVSRVALTTDFQMHYIEDPSVQEFYRHHLGNYKIDWI